jgi:hypothetical protein
MHLTGVNSQIQMIKRAHLTHGHYVPAPTFRTTEATAPTCSAIVTGARPASARVASPDGEMRRR